jgi:hypothetical protein
MCKVPRLVWIWTGVKKLVLPNRPVEEMEAAQRENEAIRKQTENWRSG